MVRLIAIVFYTMFGLAVGGLINVLADVLPHRRRPRVPFCLHCDQTYPPAGWLALVRGRCPACGERPHGWRPRLVELGTALMFAFLWWRFDGFSLSLLATSVYFAVFILIFVTDMEHRLILHAVTFPAILFALLASPLTVTPISALLGAAVGFLFFWLIYLLGAWVFGAGAMGFGDVTLATLIGAAVGFPLVIAALLIGILAGGLVTIVLLITRVRRMRSKVPYGPFLLIGAAITLVWGSQIVEWYLR